MGRDGTAAMIVRFSDAGTKEPSGVDGLHLRASRRSLRLGSQCDYEWPGQSMSLYAVDRAAEGSLKTLVAPSCFIGILLSWFCLRSIRAAVAVLIIAGVGQLLAIAAVSIHGRQV